MIQRITEDMVDYFFTVLLTVIVIIAIGLVSCSQMTYHDQQKEQDRIYAEHQCLQLAHECFTGMHRLQKDRTGQMSLANTCLWRWQSLRCHELQNTGGIQ